MDQTSELCDGLKPVITKVDSQVKSPCSEVTSVIIFDL